MLIAVVRFIESWWLVVQHSVEIYGALVAALFASLGIWLGLTLTRPAVTVVVREVVERELRAGYAGGVLIHPIGVVLCRVFGRSGQHTHGNPLGPLALETTVWLVLSMPIAYVVSLVRLNLFFPAMLLVIGGRYTTFATIYGRRVFWACGVTLVAAAYGLASMRATAAAGAFTGAVIEAVFAVVIIAMGGPEPEA